MSPEAKVSLPPPPSRGEYKKPLTVAAARSIEVDQPKECGVCGTRFFDGEIIDGLTYKQTQEYMCPPCHKQFGVGFGPGKGVLYKFNPAAGAWYKMPDPPAPKAE